MEKYVLLSLPRSILTYVVFVGSLFTFCYDFIYLIYCCKCLLEENVWTKIQNKGGGKKVRKRKRREEGWKEHRAHTDGSGNILAV